MFKNEFSEEDLRNRHIDHNRYCACPLLGTVPQSVLDAKSEIRPS